MQLRDKIGKSSWLIQESIKDTVITNVTMAIKNGQIKFDMTQLQILLAVLSSSTEAGYQKAFKVFMREIDKALLDESAVSKK